MIRNYNGPKNRRAIIALRRLSNTHQKNLNLHLDTLKKEGKLTLYYNDFFDNTIREAVFESEERLRVFMREQFNIRVKLLRIENDYFIETLINFLNENEGIFPDSKELEKIEIKAEKLRTSTNFKEETKAVAPIQMILKEILDLSEEIMLRNDAIVQKENAKYGDYITVRELQGMIIWIWNGKKGICNQGEYSFHCIYSNEEMMIIEYGRDATVHVCISDDSRGVRYIRMNSEAKSKLKTIHKELASFAEKVGIKFKSEVDYTKV